MKVMNKQHRRPVVWSDQNGIGLVLSILVVSVLSIMTYMFGNFVDNRVDERAINTARRNRDYTYKTLLRAAQHPDALWLSSQEPENATLKNCINAKSIAECDSRDPNSPRSFKLVMPLSKENGQQEIVMTTLDLNDPQGGFDRFGNDNCPVNGKCLFRGETKFWLECPGGINCDRQGRIMVRVVVRRNAGWEQLANDGSVKRLIGNLSFGTRDSGNEGENVAVPVMSIHRLALEACPPGAYSTGLNEKGVMQCRCWMNPSQGGTSVCQPAKCPAGQEIVGIKINSNFDPSYDPGKSAPGTSSSSGNQFALDCKVLAPKPECGFVTSAQGGSSVVCPGKWQMTGFTPPRCWLDYPSNLAELDNLIENNQWEVSRKCTKYEKVEIIVGWKPNGKPITKKVTTSNCEKWDIKYKKCGRKDFDCWSKFVPAACTQSKAKCCPR